MSRFNPKYLTLLAVIAGGLLVALPLIGLVIWLVTPSCPEPPRAPLTAGAFLAPEVPPGSGGQQESLGGWMEGATERRVEVDLARELVTVRYRRADGEEVVERWRMGKRRWLYGEK